MKTIIKFSFLVFALSTTHLSYATSENITGVNLQSPEKTLQYWTAERLANAKEMPHPQFDPNGVKEIDALNCNNN